MAAPVDGDLADRPQQEGHRPDVVLVAVRQDDRLEGVGALEHVGEVGQDDVHAHLVVLGEGDAAVDDDHPAVALDHVHVLADLAGAAERDHPHAGAGPVARDLWLQDQARERMPRRSSTVREMSRCTGVASTSGSRSRPEG